MTRSPGLAWLATFLRVALGGLFVFAAVMKLRDPQQFAFSVKAFQMPFLSVPLMQAITYIVPWTELIAGSALILGLWTRSAALVIGLMLAAFIAGIVSVLARHLDVNCSCFGNFEAPCHSPVGACHLVRNGVLLSLAISIIALGPGMLALTGRGLEPPPPRT